MCQRARAIQIRQTLDRPRAKAAFDRGIAWAERQLAGLSDQALVDASSRLVGVALSKDPHAIDGFWLGVEKRAEELYVAESAKLSAAQYQRLLEEAASHGSEEARLLLERGW